jgi:peroxiredoxin
MDTDIGATLDHEEDRLRNEPDSDEGLAAQIERFRATAAARPGPDVAATFARERDRQVRIGEGAQVAEIGSKMPDGELIDVNSQLTSLASVREGRREVVVFYRGAWCPYCNLTLRAYEQQLVPSLDELGAVLIAISPQTPDGSLSVKEAQRLSFAVLSDPGNKLAAELGIVAPEISDEAREAAASQGIDFSELNADGMAAVPMATTVIVDAQNVIRWIDVHPDWVTRTEPAQILEAISAV